jgi:hypothetical protein
VNCRDAVFFSLSVTVTAMVKEPAVLGIPLSTPPALRLKPPGTDAADQL